jgi:hypothetical protein
VSATRIILGTISTAVFLAASPGSVSGTDDTKGIAIKIQLGGHLLTQDTGLVADEPGSSEQAGGALLSLALLGKDRSRFPYGVCMDIEGNRVDVGPEFLAVGVQSFGIATVRVMGQMEVRLRGPQREPRETLQPYATFGVGWNFNSTGAKVSWLGSPPPAGAPVDLDLDGSPAVRVGLGFHSKGTQRGLSANMEGGWKWNAGDFRMRVAEEPGRTGTFDLSGVYFLFGITLRT